MLGEPLHPPCDLSVEGAQIEMLRIVVSIYDAPVDVGVERRDHPLA